MSNVGLPKQEYIVRIKLECKTIKEVYAAVNAHGKDQAIDLAWDSPEMAEVLSECIATVTLSEEARELDGAEMEAERL